MGIAVILIGTGPPRVSAGFSARAGAMTTARLAVRIAAARLRESLMAKPLVARR
jgi:hypothetical protein